MHWPSTAQLQMTNAPISSDVTCLCALGYLGPCTIIARDMQNLRQIMHISPETQHNLTGFFATDNHRSVVDIPIYSPFSLLFKVSITFLISFQLPLFRLYYLKTKDIFPTFFSSKTLLI